MTWETFYDRLYDWADSTQISNISKLTDFGPSAEVCEIATSFVDEKAATRLVKKALTAGVRFTSAEVLELDGCVSEELLPELVRSVSTKFTADELDTISVSLSEADLKAAAKNSNLELDEDNFVVLEPNEMDAQVDQMLKDLDVIEENLKHIPQPRAKSPALEPYCFLHLQPLAIVVRRTKKERNTMVVAMVIVPTAQHILATAMAAGTMDTIMYGVANLAAIMVAVASTEGKLCVWRSAYCTWAHN